MAHGYIPPIDGAKSSSSVDKFLQYRRKFQQTTHNGNLSPTWFADTVKGFHQVNNANPLGATNK